MFQKRQIAVLKKLEGAQLNKKRCSCPLRTCWNLNRNTDTTQRPANKHLERAVPFPAKCRLRPSALFSGSGMERQERRGLLQYGSGRRGDRKLPQMVPSRAGLSQHGARTSATRTKYPFILGDVLKSWHPQFSDTPGQVSH